MKFESLNKLLTLIIYCNMFASACICLFTLLFCFIVMRYWGILACGNTINFLTNIFTKQSLTTTSRFPNENICTEGDSNGSNSSYGPVLHSYIWLPYRMAVNRLSIIYCWNRDKELCFGDCYKTLHTKANYLT
jgi:hypothetical protein